MKEQYLLQNSLADTVQEIKSIVRSARQRVITQVNTQLLATYWNIGRVIVEYELKQQARADYGAATLKEMAKALTIELGKGYSRSNLYNMKQFYETHKKIQTVSGKLSWSHYCELVAISDPDKQRFYEAEVNDADDNPPIGIILCTDKDRITAEYAQGGVSNNIFASKYVLYIPDKEQLIAQEEAVMNQETPSV